MFEGTTMRTQREVILRCASGDQWKSQTRECNSYIFQKAGDQYKFTIIDTPGIGDTDGPDQDSENLDMIAAAARRVRGGLNAIFIIANGRQPRWAVAEATVFGRLKGFLPDAFKNNIILVVTQCATADVSQFPLKMFLDCTKITTRSVFYMDNSAFAPKRMDDDDPDAKKVALASRQTHWDLSMKQLVKIVNLVSSMMQVDASDFEKMRLLRFDIKQKLNKSKLDIMELLKIQEQVDTADAMSKQYGLSATQFSNYTQTHQVEHVEQVPAPYHSTLCSSCNHVCHNQCGLNEITSKGDNAFKNCMAFSSKDNCTYCPSKCSYTVHFHGHFTYQKTSKSVEKVLEDIKAKHDDAMLGSQKHTKVAADASSARELMKQAIVGLQTNIQTQCQSLLQICSGFNFVDELVITLTQLKAESRVLCTLSARQSMDSFIKFLKRLIASFQS